jgi:type IV secretion system protein VirB4
MSKSSARGRSERIGPRAGERLPYQSMVDDHTLLLRDGSMLQILHLEGFAFETADVEDLNHQHFAREMALRSVAKSGLVLHHHVIRSRISVGASHPFEDPVCSMIDARWRDRLAERALFANNLFISVLLRAPRGKAGLAKGMSGAFSANARSLGGPQMRRLRELDAAREALVSALSDFSPRLLTDYDSGHGLCSGPVEFLSALFHGELHPALRPNGDVGRHIPYQRISFGHDCIQMEGAGGTVGFAGVLSLKEYPAQAMPGMTDALLRLPFQLTLSESFAFLDRQIGLERITLGMRRLRAADDDTNSLRRGLAEAKDELAAGKAAMGEHHFSVLVRAETLADLDRAMADCASALADFGATPVREQINLEPVFWAQFPGNEAFIARRAMISTAAFAGFASLHGFPLGQDEGHWGQALCVLETTAATPFSFNFHVGDLGHFIVIGPSGSGKTVALNFLTAQAQKVQPRTFFFDKDRGAEIFIRAVGGRYTGLRPGEASGFNPMQLPDTPLNRAFLRTWLAQLLRPSVGALDAEDEAVIARAVDANFDQEFAFRRLSYFHELLGGSRRPNAADLSARLAPWRGQGERAWLFDSPVDLLDTRQRVLGFDITSLLDDPVLRTPALMYLFHRVEERLTGEPALIVIDEGWKALDDPIFSARIRDWLKTLRKRNAAVGFGTQSARDALDTGISTALVEQSATQIFMPNARAQEADYCLGFGLTAHELGLIRALPPQAHCFLIKQAGRSVVARLDLSGMPDLIKLLSGREATVRRLDELRAALGDAPELWWRALIGTDYPGGGEDAPTLQRLRVVR